MKTIVTAGIIILVLVFGILPIFGLPINTGSGSQTGFVSAVEKSGVIFKTNRVYIKPTLESTQEDFYCVVDDAVYLELEKASIEKSRVKVSHYSLMSAGVKNCDNENAIIEKVETI